MLKIDVQINVLDTLFAVCVCVCSQLWWMKVNMWILSWRLSQIIM